MSFFDHLRPKWQHSDPVIRAQAVENLDDQAVLERIARDDPAERVRLLALQKLDNQEEIARFACGSDVFAVPAARRLTDRALIIKVASDAPLREVREIALDRIDDSTVLHRIATSDTDPWIRARARSRRMGPDQQRDYIRSELSKLRLAREKAEHVAELCGSLEDICTALTGNGSLRINGGVDPAAAKVSRETRADEAKEDADYAQFLASKLEPSSRSDSVNHNVFYEIMVWRTEENAFECRTEEKRLKVTQNSTKWGRVSNGPPTGTPGVGRTAQP